MRSTLFRGFLVAVAFPALVHCGAGNAQNAGTATPPQASSSAADPSAPEHRKLARPAWESARTAGDYTVVPVPEGTPRRETGCVKDSDPKPPPKGTIRLHEAVPDGSSSFLVRERGSDRVWMVVETHTLSMPHPDMATPAIRCFVTDVPLPAGTRYAGTIDVTP